MRGGRGGRKDHNHSAITAAFLSIPGVSIFDLSDIGRGVPDLIVGVRGESLLVEIKNPATHYGRKGLNRRQLAFQADWKGGPIHVVRTIDDVIELVNSVRL
jgi:hypothetical protein